MVKVGGVLFPSVWNGTSRAPITHYGSKTGPALDLQPSKLPYLDERHEAITVLLAVDLLFGAVAVFMHRRSSSTAGK